MSQCSLSCPPLSWGCAGRPRSKSIPRATHHADNRLNPCKACTLAKGAPLSERIASGKPCLFKDPLKGLTHRLAARIVQRSQLQHVAAELIADRQGFTPPTLSKTPPPLEIHCPHLIGYLSSASTAQPPSFQRPLSHTAWFGQTHLLKHPLKTALAWRLPVAPLVQRPNLARSPMSMRQLELHHFAHLCFAQLLGTAARPPRIFLH